MRREFAIPLLWLAAAVLVQSPPPAVAQTSPAIAPTPLRAERRVLLGVGLVYPMTLDHDVTGPLPSLRLGVNISPRLVLELTGSSIPYEVSGRVTLIDVGLRWHLTDGPLSPYVMAHAGNGSTIWTKGASEATRTRRSVAASNTRVVAGSPPGSRRRRRSSRTRPAARTRRWVGSTWAWVSATAFVPPRRSAGCAQA